MGVLWPENLKGEGPIISYIIDLENDPFLSDFGTLMVGLLYIYGYMEGATTCQIAMWEVSEPKELKTGH